MLKRLVKHELSIGVDIDGVLADCDTYLRWIFKMDFNKDFEIHDMIPKQEPGELYSTFVSRKELEYAVDMLHQRHAIELIPMIPDAKIYIKKLAKEFNIKLITNRPASAKVNTDLWLGDHKLYYNSLVMTETKTLHMDDCFCLIDDNWNN